MTPFAVRLQLKLDQERLRMANEWFFKWHFIGRDGPVEIDSFDGRKITYGGLKFDGTPRLVYWCTINRYLQNKVGEIFDHLESDLKSYPRWQMTETIEETKSIVERFVHSITNEAVDKDRILRGNGLEFPLPALGEGEKIRYERLPEIAQRSDSLRRHFQLDSRIKRIEHFLRDHNELTKLAIAMGTGGILAVFLRWLLTKLG